MLSTAAFRNNFNNQQNSVSAGYTLNIRNPSRILHLVHFYFKFSGQVGKNWLSSVSQLCQTQWLVTWGGMSQAEDYKAPTRSRPTSEWTIMSHVGVNDILMSSLCIYFNPATLERQRCSLKRCGLLHWGTVSTFCFITVI